MQNKLEATKKIGFMGVGNMGKAMIQSFISSGTVQPEQIYATNRSRGRLDKIQQKYGINTLDGNDELLDACDVIFLCVKPQDLQEALEPCRHQFTADQTVISIAAGIDLIQLRKWISEGNLVRVMLNTPVFIGAGVVGYCTEKQKDFHQAEALLGHLGQVISLEEGDPFEAFMVASSSGTGFIFELMTYWQDWIEDHGVDAETARNIVVNTFLGTSQLAAQSEDDLVEMQRRVVSKKGVTAAGLESFRSLEIEGLLRMSFNKATARSKDLSGG